MSMPDDPTLPPDPLMAALDSYMAALQSGRRPDRQHLLARHPELAPVLDALEALERMAPASNADPDAETVTFPSSHGSPAARESSTTEFGRYELLEEIGRGGMGVVYRARQKNLDRIVAIKVVLAGHLASPEELRRFETEARAAARLQHPHIVRVYDAGQVHGQHYFAMEYVAGSSLAELARRGPLEAETAARLMSTVARAVDHLHRQGIVHRDLKPSNILLDEKGQPFVTDFGLAKLMESQTQFTQSGVIAGTPSYMAPEQAAGQIARIGPLSDVYSLGAILYELLAGRPPFREASPLDTLVRVLESEPSSIRNLNPRVPRELERICYRCLEKTPEARYPSAAALADDLDRFLRGEVVEAQPPGAWQSVRRWARRQPALASRLGGLAVCAAVAQANYHLTHPVSLGLHLGIMGIIALWALVSVGCQWLLNRQCHAQLTRVAWAAADVLLLTAIVRVDDALLSPLVIGYPFLIAASGLWFQERLVWVTTALSVAAYASLLLDAYRRGVPLMFVNWHVIFVIVLAVLGFVVAHQVYRVRALSRYYERRPLP
ncbi:MAG: serine/threonine protein kinase [Verrucomicrobiae bacterium]|nr:serine/threonine protein kinase [Verrucomicrobiae bacterium]